MKSSLFPLCLLLAAGAVLLDAKPFFKWTDCSTTDDKTRMTVQSIKVTPDELKKGENVTVEAQFALMENITAGSAAMAEVKIDGFEFENRTYDLCNTAVRHANMKCPVAIGQHSVAVTTVVPVMSPRGPYTATARAVDSNGKELICIQVSFIVS